MPSLKIEKSLTGIICGIDEAGCSPLAGPVVAAAVILGQGVPRGVDDSKKILPARREKLFTRITENFQYGVGVASVEEIDQINIYQARFLAMERAYAALGIECSHALIDGNRGPAKLNCNIQYIIKGDTISLSIAAASIIAKVTRDRIMAGLHDEFPHYNWVKNKGYGTKIHKQAIEKHGICAHHRKSFAPVREAMERLAA